MTADNTDKVSGQSAALEAARKRATQTTRAKRDTMPSRGTAIAFSYLRVSTREQARSGGGAEGYSIPAQREACLAKAVQLGAVINSQHEYIDAGESGRSADRDDLQRMLADIKVIRPDYVIVHKIDRLARNRADDIAINLLLKKYGVTLVSCTENIDDTPSGRLLYGLMAEIAQFYSGNLAQEVLKGMIRKAEEGGTPFRAPLGYTNRRESRDGVEYAWVELDGPRAEIIAWCFEQYATGEWSGIDLTLAAQAKGLTSRPTPSRPAQPVSLNIIYRILGNPYYMGVVSYRGIHYEGKHPTLVEPDTWLAVQDVLAAHAQGEKDRVHPHYLRSTVFCAGCGGRLIYSESKGRGGVYPYFYCVRQKLKSNECTRGGTRAEKVEAAVAEFYGHFQLRSSVVKQIGDAIRRELVNQQQEARRSLERATTHKKQVENERQKLLQAHYAGAIPQDLLATEMNRLTRDLVLAEGEIKAAKAGTSAIEQTLAAALAATGNSHQAYLNAQPSIRRQMNQGFFEKLYIGRDGTVERAAWTDPFRSLLDLGEVVCATPGDGSEVRTGTDDRPETTTTYRAMWNGSQGGVAATTERDQKNTDRPDRTVGGVKQTYMVGLTGFEPATP